MAETVTVTRKIGRNRGKPRLWIEGKVLQDAGLTHGTRWSLMPATFAGSPGFLMSEDPEGSRKVAGKPDRPIIDIVGKTLGELGNCEVVTIEYVPGVPMLKVYPHS